MELKEFFTKYPKAALGFSGGVDSAFLLYAAKKYGADICPYYVKTVFQPRFEYEDALKFCNMIGIEMKLIEYDILSEHIITKNVENRCYYCKKALFSVLRRHAFRDGYDILIDGTNASDDISDRPGIKALTELSVLSPLRICGLTKDKIRAYLKEEGFCIWSKPAYACLATRIPHETAITETLLRRVEYAEDILKDMGFLDFRIRVYEGCARIQVRKEQFLTAAEKRGEIVKRLKPYFETIFLDMNTR